ncbi:MAG TPA: tRNA uridine-5-carboxymethylaminomethyl(34) synthesis GTPase MnmE [Saprospiraceae bacterium]|nr:tRNA uridine-5-carboxymethylaminomethyl(34) synthesis GTPase MnmE [Saprospirales bacterium]HRQ28753.1 tRNA uridine-5-carboxymethylaminomethyl(34) synthesis GTPase MnmE [Saprospiraceae bacterium]
MHFHSNDTIIAPATAVSNSAIALIRLSGTNAVACVAKHFSGKNLFEISPNTSVFGRIKDGKNAVLDEVVVTVFKSPRSYTGEDVVEISCHASPFIVREMISLFSQAGARLAEPGEFTLRAFLNGKMDLSQAEAVADLIASESKAGHNIALRQMNGQISSKMAVLRANLIDFASLLELELDFSEEDVEFADRTRLRQLVEEIDGEIRNLLNSYSTGKLIRNGIPTVISGRPNAGKSTLLNTLLQEDRAIVSDIPGTTRDTIEEVIQINGVQFRLVDTAGIRKTSDAIEATGVHKTYEKIRKSAIVIYLFDPGAITVEEIRHDLENLPETEAEIILVANKSDKLLAGNELEAFTSAFSAYELISISAKLEHNIDTLRNTLYEKVLGQTNYQQQVIISNGRHFEALSKARESLEIVTSGLAEGLPSDLVALELRQVLYYVGSITGAIGTEDVLGNIFGKFCIGK